jgi:hypothetical protein
MGRKTTTNIGLAIWRMKCFNETFVQGSTTVILLNFCAKNPPHRQAVNRCGQVLQHHTNGKAVFFGGKQATLILFISKRL